MMSMMGWGMILNMIFWVIIVGLVIYGLAAMIFKAFEKKEESAVLILKERYARGEINEEELERKCAVLKKK